MVRLAWLVHKDEVAEDGKAVELEEFLRSVLADDDEAARAAGTAPNASLTLPLHDDIDDALEALDDEVLNEEPAPDEPGQTALDQHLDEHESEDRDGGPPETPASEPGPHQLEELLDEALSETFPASDPIAVTSSP